MTDRKSLNVKFFICNKCGNIVTYLDEGKGKLTCCDEEMTELIPNSSDGAMEKHVPYVKEYVNKLLVKIGTNPHPMFNEHYIKWIALLTDRSLYIKWLKPEDTAEAMFKLEGGEVPIAAYEYCNLHGLWIKDL